MIGQSLPRLEDLALLRGRGRFIEDIHLHGQVHAWFVRSPHAHAEIVSIDTEHAGAAPGVLAVLSAADFAADGLSLMRDGSALRNRDGTPIVNIPRSPLAVDRVRHVGDTVAMVVASTREQARASAELVEVEYRELASVTDAQAAMAADAPTIWKQAPNNVALDWEGGDASACETAMARAHRVVQLRVVNNRVVVAAMETRGVVAEYDQSSRRYTVYTPTQGSNEIREGLAKGALNVPLRQIRVVTPPDVGGAFGMKIPVYAEQVLAAWAAKRLGRPVKWIAERADAFMTDGQARDHVMDAEIALDDEAKILAVRCRTVSNMGAYFNGAAPTIPTAGGTRCITGVYAIEAWHAQVQVVFTNTVPVVAYRGAGKPEYNYLIERLIDAAAREIKMDPAQIRRRNVVPVNAMPYKTATGLEFDSGEFEKNMDDALRIADRAGFDVRRENSTRQGKLRGFGFALFQEPDGFLDNRVSLAFDVTGDLTVSLTGQTAGHGHATTFAQVVASALGVDFERVYVVQGDSDRVGAGRGTGGSRTATVASGGIVRASAQIIEKGKAIAAHLFEASPADVEFEAGQFRIAGTDRAAGLDEVVAAAFNVARLPVDMEPGLEATSHYLARAYNYPCGCHTCEVEIDPETGGLRLLRYVAVNDHGVVINPMLLEGQVHGGVVQGLGQALTENCVYDSESGQLLSGSFMDYCIPRAADLPDIELERNTVPAKTNPLGVKGVGESGCTAACPAIMNAIMDAISGAGVRHIDMPATPQRLWDAFQEARP